MIQSKLGANTALYSWMKAGFIAEPRSPPVPVLDRVLQLIANEKTRRESFGGEMRRASMSNLVCAQRETKRNLSRVFAVSGQALCHRSGDANMDASEKYLIIRDQKVGEGGRGHLCLTDIWRLAGSPSTKKPADWRRLPTTDAYLLAVARNMGFSHTFGEGPEDSVCYVRRGRGGGTFGHIFAALGYGEYLDPDLAVDIKRTYARVRTGDLTLVDEILTKAEAARHHNEVRDLSKEVRKKYADALTSHGAGGAAIGYCTDAIYEVLLGGTAKELIVSRNLPAKANVRNTLPTGELLQTMNTEYLSAERIEGLNVRGKEPCAEASRQVARYVKDVFEKVREDKPLSDP